MARCQSYQLSRRETPIRHRAPFTIELSTLFWCRRFCRSSLPFCPLLLDNMSQVLWARSESRKPFFPVWERCQQCRASSAASVLLKSHFLPWNASYFSEQNPVELNDDVAKCLCFPVSRFFGQYTIGMVAYESTFAEHVFCGMVINGNMKLENSIPMHINCDNIFHKLFVTCWN